MRKTLKDMAKHLKNVITLMLTGLKVMAIAELEFGTIVNELEVNKPYAISYCRFSDILLRCDYRVLKIMKPTMLFLY